MDRAEIDLRIDFYRQSLAMIFKSQVAKETQISCCEPTPGEFVFWVNRPRWSDGGNLILSPIGWVAYTPVELESEAKKYFTQWQERLDWEEKNAAKGILLPR